MTRDGGGWSLLVSSFTNKWTKETVLKNNVMDPNLKKDFSILFKADDIKNSGNVKGSYFEYRLEADTPGEKQIRVIDLDILHFPQFLECNSTNTFRNVVEKYASKY